MTEPATLTSRPVHRVEDLFRELQDRNSRRTDRMFAWLMAAQWVFAVGYALWSTPYTWSAGQRFLHPHVLAAVVLGAVLTSLPVALVVVAPGRALTSTDASSARHRGESRHRSTRDSVRY